MSAFGWKSTTPALTLLGRSLKSRRRPDYTPPSWYRKHALMYGQYEPNGLHTNQPHPRQAHVIEKGLYSVILQKWIRFKVSSAALHEIDRKGGLDEYILLTSDEDLGGAESVGAVFKNGLRLALAERNQLYAQTNGDKQKKEPKEELLIPQQ